MWKGWASSGARAAGSRSSSGSARLSVTGAGTTSDASP